MPRAPKKCGTWGCENRVEGRTHCDECKTRKRRARRSPSSRAAMDPAERKRRAVAVSRWVKANGWTCPGYERDAHPSTDLTAAHSKAVGRGGTDSALTVLCRSCNSRQWVKPATTTP